MFGVALAFILFFQNPSAAQTGTVAGQLRTTSASPAVALRVGAIVAPPPNVRPSDGSNYYYTQPPISTTLTDNQGRYRLVNLPPGRYFIVAGATYYPSTLDPDKATVITVAPGSAAENIDFKLLRPFGGTLSGRINPKPEANVQEKVLLSGTELEEFLEVPVGSDGAFEFGHVPKGAYLLDLVPTPPGMTSSRVEVGDGDVSGVELRRPPTHVVSGRIVVQNGPLPHALLAFATPTSYVGGTINSDRTFTARLHSGRHQIDLAGMPSGYAVTSVRVGSEDASKGLVVGNADVSGVVITVAAPQRLPHLRGQIAGLSNAQSSSTKVELTGPIIGTLETAVRPDGSFEFAAVTPGMYRLRLPQAPSVAAIPVVVTWTDSEVHVGPPSR